MNQNLLKLNFFALTNIPEARVLRIPVTGDIQLELTNLFKCQENLFIQGVTVDNEIKFDGRYKPETDQLLVIDDFEDIDGLVNSISNPLTCEEFIFNDDGLISIKGIFAGYKENDNTTILIQGFDRRRIISTKQGFFSLFHSENTFVKLESSGLTFDNKLTAILKDKKLKFSSFHFVRQIFDMTAYYKEATDQDINSFSNLENIQIDNKENFIKACDSWVRKKIGLIQLSGILEKTTPEQIALAAKEFNLEIKLTSDESSKKIMLPSERQELKKILRFLDEDYYKSPLTTSTFISNSKRVVD